MAEALHVPVRGDEVLIDSSAVAGLERYVKQDFEILELHRRGVLLRMAENVRPPVGYSDALFTSSLKAADSPDWLLVLKQPGTGPALKLSMPAFLEAQTFVRYSLRGGKLLLVLAGAGWHPCDQNHCWTESEFSFEALVQGECPSALLQVDLAYFEAPLRGVSKLRSTECSLDCWRWQVGIRRRSNLH